MYYINGDIMTLKEIRIQNQLSQQDSAAIVGVPVRTFRRYECNETYGSSLKRQIFVDKLTNYCEINESKGLLSVDIIRKKLITLFDEEYKGMIDFCYLFGSYANGTAKEDSDVDLYVSSSLTGFKFVGLIERARQVLHKNIDMLRSSELVNNISLMHAILKEGIKIYG